VVLPLAHLQLEETLSLLSDVEPAYRKEKAKHSKYSKFQYDHYSSISAACWWQYTDNGSTVFVESQFSTSNVQVSEVADNAVCSTYHIVVAAAACYYNCCWSAAMPSCAHVTTLACSNMSAVTTANTVTTVTTSSSTLYITGTTAVALLLSA
jgi:hypothetical protein